VRHTCMHVVQMGLEFTSLEQVTEIPVSISTSVAAHGLSSTANLAHGGLTMGPKQWAASVFLLSDLQRSNLLLETAPSPE
jgi:hypothetical protein